MWIGPLSRLDSLSTCLCDVGLMRGPHIIAIRMSLWAWHVQSAMYRPHEMTVRHVAHWSAATTPKKGICQKYALTSFYPTYRGVTAMRVWRHCTSLQWSSLDWGAGTRLTRSVRKCGSTVRSGIAQGPLNSWRRLRSSPVIVNSTMTYVNVNCRRSCVGTSEAVIWTELWVSRHVGLLPVGSHLSDSIDLGWGL